MTIIDLFDAKFGVAPNLGPHFLSKVTFSTGTQARYCVQTILARFCDGSRQTSYDLMLVLDGLRRFLTILVINGINNELRVFFTALLKNRG